jgi:hypothetical protein
VKDRLAQVLGALSWVVLAVAVILLVVEYPWAAYLVFQILAALAGSG